MSISQPNNETIAEIQEFTGAIHPEQLRYVEYFTATQQVAMFMPVAGPCMLAVSPMHSHPAHMFVLNFADSTSIVLEHNKYRAQPDTVSFLPCRIPHHEVNETGIPRYVAIFVRPGFMARQAEAYSAYNVQLDQWTVFPSSDELLSVIKRFISECKTRKAGSDLLLEALSVETVHVLLRSMIGLKANDCTPVSRIEINRSIEYMRQNLSEKLSLQVLASFARMSVSHFTRVFRQETGLSPIDYLIDMRLEVACRLLLGGDLSLKQIAMDCGFSSPSHFSSSFQKKHKISPSGYLNASQQK